MWAVRSDKEKLGEGVFTLARELSELEAVQQSQIRRKRKANRALNPKRSEFFSVKNNCGTASLGDKLIFN